MENKKQDMVLCLWYDGQAEEAAKSQRVAQAYLQMKKFDIAALQAAYQYA